MGLNTRRLAEIAIQIMTIKILIGADICPTPTNFNLFATADLTTLIGSKLVALLKTADYTIFNLETPLTDTLSPIAKNGPCLCAPTSTIHGIKAINPHFFTLANNHILDQDVQGLRSTQTLLEQAGIAYAGVGNNLKEAGKPYIAHIRDLKLGLYCCAEHEFSIATDTIPGANPYDPLVSFDAVRELKKQCDYVIVLYHGGKEHYRYPSPQLQRVFRKFADCGANLVIAQHTHCIGCMEKYSASTLVYGQGNFLFTAEHNEYWDNSLLIQAEIHADKSAQISFLPCACNGTCIQLAEGKTATRLVADFQARSQQIQTPGFIQKQYTQFSANLVNSYLQICTGKIGRNIFVRLVNKLTGHRLAGWFYNKQDRLKLQNILKCEAHREVFLQALKRKEK